MNEWKLLDELIAQGHFELLLPEQQSAEEEKASDLRLVYIMNDAVESFLVFRNARMTGSYDADYEGELDAAYEKDPQGTQDYHLVVHQGESVFTIFFTSLELEIQLYNYGEMGHFWVKGYEYLRLLEYRLGILRDKYDYLGKAACNSLECRLAALVNFPPLNYTCYSSVPEQYIVPIDEPWLPTEEAIRVMEELAEDVGDHYMIVLLGLYRRSPTKLLTHYIARLMRTRRHAALVDHLTEQLRDASCGYGRRIFSGELEERYQRLMRSAEQRQRELAAKGIQCEVLTEAPFTVVPDSVGLHVYLMIWKNGVIHRRVRIEEMD